MEQLGGLRLYTGDGTGKSWQLARVGLPDAQYVAPASATRQVAKKLTTAYGIDVADVDRNGNLDIIRTYKFTIAAHVMMTSPLARIEVWGR